MGWSYGHNLDGREIGYAVPATCDKDGCDEKINRGLEYVCGGMHDAEWGIGCGNYFCYGHLVYTGVEDPVTGEDRGAYAQLCEACAEAWEAEALVNCDECGHLGGRHDRRAEPKRYEDPIPACGEEGCECDEWVAPLKETA